MNIYSSMEIARSRDTLYKVSVNIVAPMPAPDGSGEIESRFCSLSGYARYLNGALVVFKQYNGGSNEKEPPVHGFRVRISDDDLKIETDPDFREGEYCGLYVGFTPSRFLIKDRAIAVMGNPFQCKYQGVEISCFTLP